MFYILTFLSVSFEKWIECDFAVYMCVDAFQLAAVTRANNDWFDISARVLRQPIIVTAPGDLWSIAQFGKLMISLQTHSSDVTFHQLPSLSTHL
jgi:hypothetical protein